MLLVTKLLYPDVAKLHATTYHSVERSMRTATKLAWNTNRPCWSSWRIIRCRGSLFRPFFSRLSAPMSIPKC
ncbi:MAG: hypothetical protein IKC76_01650 [Firmicutes bacterium]|nr:hypothetical protein [Bacillota bacterium]MBR7113203.1 hypothetical protein [Bacillota bacterium]